MRLTTRLNSGLLALAIIGICSAPAAELLRFGFNEGSGITTTDSTGGVVAQFGTPQNPSVDYSLLMAASPSGLPGDGCVTNSGSAFLLADDSASKVLNITNGPITLETWIYIDPSVPAKSAEGLIAYGNSYKMGMKGGRQVFTLYGIRDVTNTVAPPVDISRWVHLAAAWEPGVGVHFFMDGTEYFEVFTNLTARPVSHNYLSIGSEGLGNNSISALDRVRVHQAVLAAAEVDSVAAAPKPTYSSTLVNYGFNETSFPCTSSLSPPLPTMLSTNVLPTLTGPVWSSDTPTHLAGDYSIGFLTENPPVKESLFGSTTLDLGVNNTNYTLQAWFKMPTGPLENRRVIFRTDGPAPRVSLSINATRGLHTSLYGNTDFASSVFVPNDNRWHHVAAVMEGFARVRFYFDGILRQTINRTATAAPTAGTTPGLTMGKESETLFFRGWLDRVIINNDALTNSTLDYPAIPGLPTFATLASHPSDVFTNLGATVKFTVAPTGATGIQWYYRANLADQVGVLLPGQTSATLTLTGISAAQFGYYYAVVTNAIGWIESYAARLALTPNLQGKLIDFEPPTYTSGIVDGQDYWTNDQNGNAARVLTASEISNELSAAGITPGQTVHSGNQALLVNGANVATTTIRTFTGLETKTNLVIEFWARPLAAGALGTALGNVFVTLENAAGTRAAAVRFGANFSIDYGSTNSGVWVATGQFADPNSWYKLAFRMNYKTRFYDFYVNDVKINTDPIAFYTATSESLRQIRVFRGASQAGMLLDDLNVPAPLRVSNVSVAGGDIIIQWQGGTPPYQLQRRSVLGTGPWENVGSTTTSTQASDTVGTGPAFYRVGSD